jgi:hypothetical protein
MPLAFFAGVHWGAMGLAYAWLLAFPLVPLFTFVQARGKLGIDVRHLAGAVAPGLLGSGAMALLLVALQGSLVALSPWQRIAVEVALGAGTYAALLMVFARATLTEALGLVVRRKQPPAIAAA